MDTTSATDRRPLGWLPTAALRDLRELLDVDGPFCSVTLPAPSDVADAAQRLDVNWRTARRRLVGEHEWDDDDLADVDELMARVPHDVGEAVVLLHAAGGPTHVEFLDDPVHALDVTTGALPRLAPVIESRQRAVPHIVVETDRTGADITAFAGGEMVDRDTVDGETLHIHRSHPGGWSQRRFQQRAENRWESNAKNVAEAIEEAAERIDAQLIVLSGDVRAKSLVASALLDSFDDRVAEIEAGSADAIAVSTVRLVSDLVAGDIRDLSVRFRDARAQSAAVTGVEHTLAALATGRIETLLVHDHRDDDELSMRSVAGYEPGARVVDLAIAIALRSGAEVFVVPAIAPLDGPIGGFLRW